MTTRTSDREHMHFCLHTCSSAYICACTLTHLWKQTYLCSHSFFRSFFICSPTHFLSDALLPTHTFSTFNLINPSSLLSLLCLSLLIFLPCSFISSSLPFVVSSFAWLIFFNCSFHSLFENILNLQKVCFTIIHKQLNFFPLGCRV